MAYPLDSLQNSLNHSRTTRDSIQVYLQFGKQRTPYNYKEAYDYLSEALLLAHGSNLIDLEASASDLIGTLWWLRADYPKALTHLDRAFDLYQSTNDTVSMAGVKKIIGLLHYYQGRYEESIKHLENSLDYYSRAMDSVGMAQVSSELGFVYGAMGQFEESNRYTIEALKLNLNRSIVRYQYLTWIGNDQSVQLHKNQDIIESLIPQEVSKYMESLNNADTLGVASSLENVGNLWQQVANYDSAVLWLEKSLIWYEYLHEPTAIALVQLDMARCFRNLDQISEAKKYLMLALQPLLDERLFGTADYVLDDLGKIALNEGEFELARKYFQSALAFSDTLGHPMAQCIFNRRLADVSREEGNIEEAIVYATKSYEIAEDFGVFTQIRFASEKLAELYKSAKWFEKALIFREKYDQLTRKLENAENQKNLLEFQTRFELARKNSEITLLQQEKERSLQVISQRTSWLVGTIIGAFTLIIVLVLLLHQNKKIRKLSSKLTVKSQQNEVLLREIHHRVKNNLQMVSSLIQMQKRRLASSNPLEALQLTQSRIESIALIHDHLYRTENFSTVDLSNYIRELVSIIGGSYDAVHPVIHFNIESLETNIDLATSVGLIVHELVTNSFKYAFTKTRSPELTISLFPEKDRLSMVVADNGPGTDSFTKGYGWHIIEACIEGSNGTYEIFSTDGFKAHISLENINKG